jgi:DNA repair protein RadC
MYEIGTSSFGPQVWSKSRCRDRTHPIEADRGITLRLARALALVDIRLLDHLVVSRNGHASLAERGWI